MSGRDPSAAPASCKAADIPAGKFAYGRMPSLLPVQYGVLKIGTAQILSLKTHQVI